MGCVAQMMKMVDYDCQVMPHSDAHGCMFRAEVKHVNSIA